MNKSILHLANPANEWENASPIGNGTSGMMVFGGVASDKLITAFYNCLHITVSTVN